MMKRLAIYKRGQSWLNDPDNLNGLNWEVLRSLGASKFASLATLMPFFGYIVLFNDLWVKLYNEILRALGAQTDSDLSSVSSGVILLYLGSVSFGIGMIIFKFACPPVVRDYGTDNRYLEAQFSHLTVRNLIAMAKAIDTLRKGDLDSFRERAVWLKQGLTAKKAQELFRKDPDGDAWKTEIVRSYYRVHNAYYRRGSAKACFWFSALGILLASIPSINVMLDVMCLIINRLSP